MNKIAKKTHHHHHHHESLSKTEVIKKRAKEVLYTSTAQALFKIVNSASKLIKTFWIICLVSACSLCAYFVIASLVTYFTYEVSLNTRTYFEVESLFPKITICNKNLFTTKYAFDLFKSLKLTDPDSIALHINYNLNDTEKIKLHHSFEDILFECSFNSQKCNSSDFIREYDKNLGNCYTFNSGYNSTNDEVSLKKSIRAGVTYGLKLVLYVS